MKIHIYTTVALSLLAAATVSGQSKIKDGTLSGTSSLPRAGALLELESNNKGLMAPRISLTNTTTWGLLGIDSAGMVVYNNNPAIAGTVAAPTLSGGVGLYYWNGDNWVGMAAGGSDFWGLKGNAGTTPPTTVGSAVGSNNFWGTTDAKNLAVGTNGVTRAVFDQNGSLYGGNQTYDSSLNPLQSLVWGDHNIDSADYSLMAGDSNTLSVNSRYTLVAGHKNKATHAAAYSAVFGQNNIDSLSSHTLVAGFNNRLGTISPIHTYGCRGAIMAGTNNTALYGIGSATFGMFNMNRNTGSLVAGQNDTSLAAYNCVVGSYNKCIGSNSIVGGEYNETSSIGTLVTGTGNKLEYTAERSVVGGQTNYLSGSHAAVSGYNNKDSANYTLVAGEGNVVGSSGAYGITAGYRNTVKDQYSIAMGRMNAASGFNAQAIGFYNTASGTYSTAIGTGNNAAGYSSVAIGGSNIATGDVYSLAMGQGSRATGSWSVAIGSSCRSEGIGSISLGNGAKAIAENSVALGSSVNMTHRGALGIGDGTSRPAANFLASTTENQMNMRFMGGYRLFSDSLYSTGVALAAGGTSWTSISDRRSKENIRSINYGLNTVMALRPAMYNYKGQKNTSLGFIAQEVKEVLPEVVELTGMGPDKDYLGVKYSELIPVLTKAIQELNNKIENLEQENRELKAENAAVAELGRQLRELQQIVGIKEKLRGNKTAKR